MLEKTLESPLDCKELKLVHPKGDQSWVFIGRNDVKAETPILWPPDAKRWLIWKDSDAGKDWGQEEKGMTEDEMVGWHHRFNGHGFGWTPGVYDGQGGLVCYGSLDHKELDTSQWLNWTELNRTLIPVCGSWCTLQKGASLVTQTLKTPPTVQKTRVCSLHWEDPWRRELLPTPVFLPWESLGKRSLAGYSAWVLKVSWATKLHDWATRHSEYKLNKQLNTVLTYSLTSFEWVRCSMSAYNYCFVTFIQAFQEEDKVVWYSHVFKNFPVFSWSTQSKAFV